MPQLDFPDSPVSGTTYAAPNGITYTYNTSIGTGVWVAATSSPLSVTAGSISGTASVGSTLTYTPGTASGGSSPYTYAYQWKANGSPIGGATGLTYVVVSGNAGQSITVTITATDSTTATASATTTPTVIPTALAVTAGSIAGTAQVGSTLTYTAGTASGGVPPVTTAWVWKSGSTTVGVASSTTYVPVVGDVGNTITVEITATDSTSQTATATTAPTAAVVTTTIPTATYNPSPSGGPAASNTVSTGTWNGTADTLSSTGCIEISVNGGAYSQGPTAVTNGQNVSMRWVDSPSCTGAADGTVITGDLTAASGGTNPYSLTVDTAPSNFSFTDLTSQALSTAVTSASITLAGTNVDTFLTKTGGTLTTIEASIAGGAFAAIPASGTSMPVQPGQTIQIRGTTGASSSTGYTAILALGTATTTWTATTTAVVASITTPSITSPANGATNLNPVTNSPAGIPLVGDSYSPQNGAGATQTSSTWEVYKWVGGGGAVPPTLEPPGANYTAVTGSPFTVSSAPFTTVSVPRASLAVSSTYYARTKYATTNVTAATSSFSGWSSFRTASSFVPSPGTAMAGGYFGGQINDGGTIYNLIVAPVSAGALSGTNTSGIAYKTTADADAPSATVQNEVYGGPTTDLFKASAAHPVFSAFINGATGPNAGAFNLSTGGAGGGTGIGGFNDWYLPAKNELEILYFNLKPDTTTNNTSSGANPNAVPARANNYTDDTPAQTTAALFAGGAQAFFTAAAYWSSSEGSSDTTTAWAQYFSDGGQYGWFGVKDIPNYARAIRRIAA